MYDYHRRKPVKSFNDSTGKLSSGMKAIYNSIKAVAIDDLTEKKFREFYESSAFKRADFTDIIDSVTSEKVGFLYATFYDDPTGTPRFTAKAFQAVTKEKRQIGKPFDRSKLYKKFMEFYLEKILFLELLKTGSAITTSWLIKGSVPSFSDIENLITSSIGSVSKKEHMQIEIFAENPTTYFDICDHKLEHQSVKPKTGELAWVDKLTIEELLLESFRLSEKYEKGLAMRPKYLEPTTFTVNITPQEWRYSFKTTKKEKKFYIWQNYQFPNYAFKVIIPVNPDNILTAIFRIIEKKGNKAITKFLQETSAYLRKESKKKSLVKALSLELLALTIDEVVKNFKSGKTELPIPDYIKTAIKKYLGV